MVCLVKIMMKTIGTAVTLVTRDGKSGYNDSIINESNVGYLSTDKAVKIEFLTIVILIR